MSIIWFCFEIINRLLICFLDLAWVIKKLRVLLSLTYFIRDVSIIMFGDCFKAFFNICSREFDKDDFGDFISYLIPFSAISAVCRFASGTNSTWWPAAAKMLATRNSCGHGLHPAGIITSPFDFILAL